MTGSIAKYTSYGCLALLAYQLQHNVRSIIDMGPEYQHLDTILYYVVSLLPAVALSLYTISLSKPATSLDGTSLN